MLTKSAASELSERLWADYQAFASRDLSEFKVLYLFVDGIAEKLHLGQPREAVLAACRSLARGQGGGPCRLPGGQPELGTDRRRTKAFGERAVLKLMYAALIRASEPWKRVVISEFELKQPESLREHLNRVHAERTAPVKPGASRSRISSNART